MRTDQMCRIMKNALLILLLAMTGNLLAQTFSANKSLTGETLDKVTSISFGPDQRLYALDVTGDIHIYTINRTGGGLYEVDSSEILTFVTDIQNHFDDGTVDSHVERQATGICVVGTPSNPVIYATSSDYRFAELFDDLNLDTNSGTISRITWNGTSWEHVIIVRGLPRSEENHATNGLFYDESANMLYVAQGGNTNAGSPSDLTFLYLCEFAYSNAILTVDLDAIEAMPIQTDTSSGVKYIYNLPTVDDPTRDNANGINNPMTPGYDGVDLHDPFGGNDGLNQAKLTVGSPVQVYSGGYRNAYDVVKTELGHLYTWDNGPNPGWGGAPLNEGVGTSNNQYSAANFGGDVVNKDGLHHITSSAYYGGHPNPIRCNPDSAGLYTHNGITGVWRTAYDSTDASTSLPYDWPPVDSALANPYEGVYMKAGSEDSSLYVTNQSTNGLCEYTASNFGNAMKGDLLAVGLQGGDVYRVNLDSNGLLPSPDSVTIVIDANGQALDVIAMGDGTLFPGTVWVARYNPSSSSSIYVFEPVDFSACEGNYSNLIDEDGDGYTNSDEIDNGTSPCNAADVPDDFDGSLIGGFKVSNLNDPDDDDDGINDTLDLFVWDSLNGSYLIPQELTLFADDPGTGFLNLGFTGLMMNGTDDYLDLEVTEEEADIQVIAGGAVGILTYIGVDTGDARSAMNNQVNAYQMGFEIDSTYDPVVVEVSLFGPVFTDSIENYKSVGAYIGTGDQDNYIKLAVSANGGTPGLELVIEDDGVVTSSQYAVPGIDTVIQPVVGFIVSPANGYVQPQYRINAGEPIDVGDGFYVEGDFLASLRDSSALAVGVISTSRGATTPFNASWDNISVAFDTIITKGLWVTQNDATSCQSQGAPGSCCQGRHEASFVESGDKWYLMGGREHDGNVNIYDPVTDSWTIGATPPGASMHHYQAVDYHGLILVAGAMRSDELDIFEEPIDTIYVYDPLDNSWYAGPAIPSSRARAAAGVVLYNDTLYMTGGMTGSHLFLSGSEDWSDKYALRSGNWTELPDAPHRRDHFHAAMVDGKIYAASGRRTGEGASGVEIFGDTEPEVDVFDIQTQSWTTLGDSIPTERAGAATAVLDKEIIIIGGENGSDTDSNDETEALDTETGTWRSLDAMNYARNGIQALVNNGGIYVVSGAQGRGGNQITKSTEAFYFAGETTPQLTAYSQSTLVVADTLTFGATGETSSSDMYVQLYNTGGSQALLVSSIAFDAGLAFTVDSTGSLPRLIAPGDSLTIKIQFTPDSIGVFSDSLLIQHSGSNAPSSQVLVNGNGIINWIGTDRIYVDSAATGSNSGDSWADAYPSLATALEVARNYPQVDEVWLASGSYYPGSQRDASFELVDSVSIYGGFNATENSVEQRNPEINPVFLDGDIGILNDTSDNAYHVVSIDSSSSGIEVYDVTIRNGNANGAGADEQVGAGLLVMNASVALTGVSISNCYGTLDGSAIYVSGSLTQLNLEGITISGCSIAPIDNKSGANIQWAGSNVIR